MAAPDVSRPRGAGGRDGAVETKSSRQHRDSTDERQQLELFEKGADTPSLPTRGTLAWTLLLHLCGGASVTHPEWEDLTGSWRLAATVCVLRALGWPVIAAEVPAPTPESPQRSIARYRMAREGIDYGRDALRQARRAAA